MSKQKLEIECPICDAKLSIDARSCPKCGVDLGMADFQDLENLANDISGVKATKGEAPEKPVKKDCDPVPSASEGEAVSTPGEETMPNKNESEPENEPAPPTMPKEDNRTAVEEGDSGKKKGLFSKLFGKKK